LFTILDMDPAIHVTETAILNEENLAEDWNRPEEDSAWHIYKRLRSPGINPVLQLVPGEAEAAMYWPAPAAVSSIPTRSGLGIKYTTASEMICSM
jgi:hypothetical protein